MANSTKAIAKELRKRQTPEEKKLWFLLQDRRLSGFKFRRQVWVGQYCVDFCCYEVRLIIELDGGYHKRPVNKLYDFKRTGYLENQGFQVLRFWNSEVNNHEKSVLEKIRESLRHPSSVRWLNRNPQKLTSSPTRGEEKRK